MPTSPNMSMNIPVVGVTPAPDWASLIVSCFNVIDSHDHTTGSGVPITPGAININSALSFGSNNATALRVARFTAQVSAIPATGAELQQIYVAGVDLYYNDGSGNQIRITQSGSVTGASGTITGLPSGTASAAYSAGSAKFIWQSATNTSADMDFGAAIMRNATASSYGLTLQPPTLAANYSITLPALPASQKIMTLDASGIMSAPYSLDGSTIAAAANVIGIPAGGVDTTQLANGSVTPAKKAALGQQISSSAGYTFTSASSSFTTVTNQSVTITTTGRPVFIGLQGDGSDPTGANVRIIPATAGTWYWCIKRDGTIVNGSLVGNPTVRGPFMTPSSFSFTDTPAAGTYTYIFQIASDGANTIIFQGTKMVAYEL